MGETVSNSVEYVGEFVDRYSVITVNGYLVPGIKARKLPDDSWELSLDGRFAISATGNEIQKWMWFVANAMAVAGGYSCFGENAKPTNPYKTILVGLSMDELQEMTDAE